MCLDRHLEIFLQVATIHYLKHHDHALNELKRNQELQKICDDGPSVYPWHARSAKHKARPTIHAVQHCVTRHDNMSKPWVPAADLSSLGRSWPMMMLMMLFSDVQRLRIDCSGHCALQAFIYKIRALLLFCAIDSDILRNIWISVMIWMSDYCVD